MAIYPSVFGHVDLPSPEPLRRMNRHSGKEIGVRLVRPVDPYTDQRRRADRSRP